jgi:hypothetical protein
MFFFKRVLFNAYKGIFVGILKIGALRDKDKFKVSF